MDTLSKFWRQQIFPFKETSRFETEVISTSALFLQEKHMARVYEITYWVTKKKRTASKQLYVTILF